jgi:hypothetical protein
MKVNYIYLLITIAVTTLVILIVTNIKKKKSGQPTCKLGDYFINTFTAVMFIGMFLRFASSTVIEIINNTKYSEHVYFFYFKDHNGESHFVLPFTNYVSNASNIDVKIYPVIYGRVDNDDVDDDEYICRHEFKRIKNKPQYILEEPAHRVSVKGGVNGTVRYALSPTK